MIAHNNETEIGRHALAISVWEDEGGAPASEFPGHHYYGRRIEVDGSWSIYHVFTGVAANIGGFSLTGLSRSSAARGMMSLNRRYEEWRRERERFPLSGSKDAQICEVRP
jgi:hypothetical protein